MEGLGSFAIWLFIFGIVGTSCLQLDFDLMHERSSDTKPLDKGSEDFEQIDQQEQGKTVKKRVVRWTPFEGWHVHPTSDEMIRARNKARLLRNEATTTPKALAQKTTRPQHQQNNSATRDSKTTNNIQQHRRA